MQIFTASDPLHTKNINFDNNLIQVERFSSSLLKILQLFEPYLSGAKLQKCCKQCCTIFETNIYAFFLEDFLIQYFLEKEEKTAKAKQTQYIKRVVVHPHFHNIPYKVGDCFMVSSPLGPPNPINEFTLIPIGKK